MDALKLVQENKITNKVCSKTGLPIFADEEMYMLDGEPYHSSVDMDEVIREYTDGEYSSVDELYDDNSDYYYFTTNDDEDTVAECIEEDGKYYDENGKLHTIG